MKRDARIVNEKGLHARAAAKFCELAGKYEARIRVVRGSTEVSGMSIMGLMMLAASPGSTITISGHGPDAEAAVNALCDLVAGSFHEE